MQESVYSPGEIIFNKGDLDNKLYFILKGDVEYFDLKNLKKFSFGQI